MIVSFEDKTPQIDDSAWVSQAAYVVGAVKVGENSSVWPGAVLRADFSTISVGANTHVEDNCVLHSGGPMIIGDDNVIGHGVIVHCGRIGNNCLIGNNATLLEGAEIDDFCIVAAHSLIPPGTKVPTGSMAMGVPAEIRELSPQQKERLKRNSSGGLGYRDLSQRYKASGL